MYEWTRVMRKYTFGRGSTPSRYLRASCRFYTPKPSTDQDAAPDAGRGSNPLGLEVANEPTPPELPAPLGLSSGTARQPFHAVRRPLPLSPLMDPAYQAAKQKHQRPKAAPSKNPTPFQQQLAKNPYARALATPIRMCALTRTWLPSFFLQDFELIAHPSTGEAWYLPRSLTSAHVSSPSAPDSTETLPARGSRHGPRAYTLSRLSLLNGTLRPKSGYTKGYERFPSARSTQWKAFRARKIRWRDDIDTFVLELMRRRVVEGLKYLSGRRKGYLVPCERGWGHVEARKQLAAVLWLGGISDGDGGVDGGAEDGADAKGEGKEADGMVRIGTGPREFATLDLDKEFKSKIPVYNLRVLLGDEHVKGLTRESRVIYGHELVVLKSRRTTIDLQLRLWKLQGYLATHQ